MQRDHAREHAIAYATLVKVWLALLCLTTLLVFVSKAYHEALSVWAMLTITPLKAGLVFFYFMHLKYERTYIKAMVLVTLALLVLFIGLIFLDISFR